MKITAPRREILKILSSSPLSAREVKDNLKEVGFNVDLVTVYRTLELFESLGLIQKTEFEDHIARFEAVRDHHHHLVCIKCGMVEDVIINEGMFVSQIEKQSKFKVQKHALEFFGFCQRCQF